MFEVQQTARFKKWLTKLRDKEAARSINDRIDRLKAGHLGDTKSVGDGVSECRMHHGPGYRLYFTRKGEMLIVLLVGGDKGSQDRDITRAKEMVKLLEK